MFNKKSSKTKRKSQVSKSNASRQSASRQSTTRRNPSGQRSAASSRYQAQEHSSSVFFTFNDEEWNAAPAKQEENEISVMRFGTGKRPAESTMEVRKIRLQLTPDEEEGVMRATIVPDEILEKEPASKEQPAVKVPEAESAAKAAKVQPAVKAMESKPKVKSTEVPTSAEPKREIHRISEPEPEREIRLISESEPEPASRPVVEPLQSAEPEREIRLISEPEPEPASEPVAEPLRATEPEREIHLISEPEQEPEPANDFETVVEKKAAAAKPIVTELEDSLPFDPEDDFSAAARFRALMSRLVLEQDEGEEIYDDEEEAGESGKEPKKREYSAFGTKSTRYASSFGTKQTTIPTSFRTKKITVPAGEELSSDKAEDILALDDTDTNHSDDFDLESDILSLEEEDERDDSLTFTPSPVLTGALSRTKDATSAASTAMKSFFGSKMASATSAMTSATSAMSSAMGSMFEAMSIPKEEETENADSKEEDELRWEDLIDEGSDHEVEDPNEEKYEEAYVSAAEKGTTYAEKGLKDAAHADSSAADPHINNEEKPSLFNRLKHRVSEILLLEDEEDEDDDEEDDQEAIDELDQSSAAENKQEKQISFMPLWGNKIVHRHSGASEEEAQATAESELKEEPQSATEELQLTEEAPQPKAEELKPAWEEPQPATEELHPTEEEPQPEAEGMQPTREVPQPEKNEEPVPVKTEETQPVMADDFQSAIIDDSQSVISEELKPVISEESQPSAKESHPPVENFHPIIEEPQLSDVSSDTSEDDEILPEEAAIIAQTFRMFNMSTEKSAEENTEGRSADDAPGEKESSSESEQPAADEVEEEHKKESGKESEKESGKESRKKRKKKTKKNSNQNPGSEDHTETEADSSDESISKKSSVGRIFFNIFRGVLLIAILVLLGFYAKGVYHYWNVFYPDSQIGDVNVGGLTASEAEAKLVSVMEEYTLTVRNKVDDQTITAQDVDMQFVTVDENGKNQVELLLHKQNALLWPIFERMNHEIETLAFTYDEEKAEQIVNKMPIVNPLTYRAPTDAYLTYDDNFKAFVIQSDEPANKLDASVVLETVQTALTKGTARVSIPDEAYTWATVRADDSRLVRMQEQAESYMLADITLEDGDDVVEIDRSVIHDFLVVDNENYTVEFSEDLLKEYINTTLDGTFDTMGKTRTFTTDLSGTFTISGGDYGKVVSTAEELTQLTEEITNGETVTRAPLYKQTEVSEENNGIGYTYVDVNLSMQTLSYVRDGVEMMQSEFVSGNTSTGHGTPTGIYSVQIKATEYTMVKYNAFVHYWMNFYPAEGVGFHDATWRGSFGGNIYKYSGSHGCINMPLSEAKELYNLISYGTPVLVHY